MAEKEKMTAKENVWQMIKFTLFSISAGIIQIVSYTLLTLLIPDTKYNWICYLTSLILSVLWNFTFNRRYTFKSAANVPVAMLKIALFYCVFTPLSTLWTQYLVDTAGWNRFIVEAGTMAINFVTEYLFSRFVVYRKSMNTNSLAKKEENESKEEI